ncbi:DNA-binding E3 ubiquitin-protein ligase SNT2 [Spizellomyces punctatus DAOM BR117]|uniref:BAH domain-containing protein n=1 Tax=Spizellomyces punctatus (strain DAOM BR117) TaxID=645134 RepID=A0A0L0HD17_SPIPD|nr:DNA-binding E3 ubiquitin-protein ligase SNT2 [Spizellomyces punctatus DAOM BR117]KNC99032.1 hypothetical protein SPPG_09338 [Spizellomyces punctatus DAOM BR117]|eukprot:XP_016607072.1 hypothetical protein SPPG_09338 [Spizellomyces punctatus DAOM BR117]
MKQAQKKAPLSVTPVNGKSVSPVKVKSRGGNSAAGSANSGKAAVTQIVAKNGETYALNDYVYLAPDIPNELYYVGRILEFVSGKLPGKQTVARIGWFYRPKDVLPGGRGKKHDPRLLLASMHSDINPISSIRGKCKVEHISHVKDMEQWRAEEDCFYYDQLYDRYTHRVYDVVPLELVKNLPREVSRALSDYQFILVEAGKASDFTERRVCNSCDRWCNPDEAVIKCVACRAAFHLGCVGIVKKPPKGYAWQCAKCNKKASDAAEEEEKTSLGKSRGKVGKKESSLPSQSNDSDSAISSEDEDVKTEVPMEEVELPFNRTKDAAKPMWPYRYFGEYAKYREILAEEGPDRGHPKAASRIGKQFQADLPDLEAKPDSTNLSASRIGGEYQADIPDLETPPFPETGRRTSSGSRVGTDYQADIPPLELPHQPNVVEETADRRNGERRQTETPPLEAPLSSAKGNSKLAARGKGKRKLKLLDSDVNEELEIPSRGSSAEVVFKMPPHMSEQQLDAYMEHIQEEMPSTLKSSDYLIDRALAELHKADYDIEAALKVMLELKARDLGVVDWAENEIKAFEGGIAKYGHELHLVHREVPAKPMTEVVAFFYKWKKSRRYAAVYSQFCKKYRPSKRFKGQKHAMDGAADAEGNLSNGDLSEDDMPPSPTGKGRVKECANCWTTESQRWKYRQKDLKKEILCLACGIHYLKYGVTRVISDTQKRANRESAPKKIIKRKRSFDNAQTPSDSERKPAKKKSRKAVAKVSLPEITFVEDFVPSSPESDAPRPCAVCTELYEPPGNLLLTCLGCKLRVHKECYGVPAEHIETTFQCARCRNIQHPECSVLYKCVLCPIVNSPRESALKRTIGNNWAHLTCAIWMPEVKFGNVETEEPVECIGLIDKKRWKQLCCICKQPEGACITCSERNCSVAFHATCAQYAGWEMTIESLKLSKSSSQVELKALAHCPRHDRRNVSSFHGETIKAVATAAATSSLHQPAPSSLTPYYSHVPPEELDYSYSRPFLIREFVLSQKRNTKPLTTSGQKRAYSMALQGTCLCHVCSAGGLHEEPSVKNLISPIILEVPKLGGRKGSSVSPTAAEAPRRKSSGAMSQSVQSPLLDTFIDHPSITRICAQCHKTVSPAWWKQKDIVEQIREAGHNVDDLLKPDKPMEHAPVPISNGTRKKRKSRDEDAEEQDHAKKTKVGDVKEEDAMLCHGCMWDLKDRAGMK